MKKTPLILLFAFLNVVEIVAQNAAQNLIFIDKQGVMRYTKDQSEAAFFGVNYTVPFAYAYRAHHALGVNHEKAIQQDVYHMARLGLNAFRVHVWDTEISDSTGNLIENEHLRLFDFLIAELKKRNIKTLITPIAFWGNGYPERDTQTKGFSRVFGRGKLTTDEQAIKAQETYLRAFFKHKNPYTNLTYEEDKDVIAAEINNEPSHSGPKQGVTDYINRLHAAIKSTGWSKPVFYNISQGPFYADAVAASNVNGFSFQWYPTGLVAGYNVKGNLLPNVDAYVIPFRNDPNFGNKALMVYEFDAADAFTSNLYPVMARSFKTAGFQWATQFAYDPLALAYANTEYQTHYLNLAYTPAKAISFLIASEVFQQVSRLKSYGTYPADTIFGDFKVTALASEMNSDDKFYYSGSTKSTPKNSAKLAKIAGVGSSQVVDYEGTGAYFLDKLENGVWRLEVMPDVVYVRDPFERPSTKKTVTAIQWKSHSLKLSLMDVGNEFTVKGVNEGNTFTSKTQNGSIEIKPGTYLVSKNGVNFSGKTNNISPLHLNEFVAPQATEKETIVRHEAISSVTEKKPFQIKALVYADDSAKVTVQLSKLGGGLFRNLTMKKGKNEEFIAEVPADIVLGGQLQYKILVEEKGSFTTYPGASKGNLYDWQNTHNQFYKTLVASETADLELYNPANDQHPQFHPTFRRNVQTAYSAGHSEALTLKLSATEFPVGDIMGFQHYVGDKLEGRKAEIFSKVLVKAKTNEATASVAKIILIDSDANAFSAKITLSQKLETKELLLSDFKPDAYILMPRPYPQFQAVLFNSNAVKTLDISKIESVEVIMGEPVSPSDKKSYSIEIEQIKLLK
jgi:hypothetical protein